MRLFLMVEGQEGVAWDDWLALADACERHGLDGLFRSDHYVSAFAPEARGSLDAWTTLAGIAARTERIRLGTLVSPVTFRHPSLLARSAATVDHISRGRVEVGLGAGWMEREHTSFGFPFPPGAERTSLLAEQLEIVHRQWTEDAFDFEGRHYRLTDSRALPKPVQTPRPRLIVGGRGGRGTVDPAVRLADEYNTYYLSAGECRTLRGRLREACERAGREPETLAFTLMTACVVGRDRDEVHERARRVAERVGHSGGPEELLRSRGQPWVTGTVDEVVARLRELAAAGIERVYLQHLDHEDLESVALLAREVAPAVADF